MDTLSIHFLQNPGSSADIRNQSNALELDQSEPYLFVGEYLNVTCTLTSQTVENGDNSSKLFFSYGWTDIEVLETETTIITNASLKYSTLMTTVFMRKYSCNLRNPVSVDPFPGSNFATVDTVYVDTELKPNPIEEIEIVSISSRCVSLKWNHKKSDREKKFIIHITSKWTDDKDLPETYQNGQMLGYIITVSSEDGKLSTNPIISRTFTSLLLPCRQEVLVSFFSRNEVGDSLEPSNISIPIANSKHYYSY
ncbi:unnamed protein product [Mytilus edulis]|uniref:Uncharacterized protein n=1 Tax=Mytilus edulis TaxID=6550 RepID=A0A8S3S4U5_MYTED|nr:unnamed protein product [Mytilus edulis]